MAQSKAQKQNHPNTEEKAEGLSTDSRPRSSTDMLEAFIVQLLEPLGYDLVDIEAQAGKNKKLRLFIEKLSTAESQDAPVESDVSIEDCVKVTHALDEPLENSKEIEAVFKGPYELEVSSPGIERALRRFRDFERYAGELARIFTFRPLSSEEMGNEEFQSQHPKQKSFLGVLKGTQGGDTEKKTVLFQVVPDDGNSKRRKKSPQKNDSSPEIKIPFELICKAHLEPFIDWNKSRKEALT
jgi:ribosome maturation factor RimP